MSDDSLSTFIMRCATLTELEYVVRLFIFIVCLYLHMYDRYPSAEHFYKARCVMYRFVCPSVDI